MSGLSPLAADRVRKGVAYLAAGVGTLWLLRVLYRLAHGRLAWNDAELWSFLALFAVMALWVRAAKPVRRTHGAEELTTSQGSGVPSAEPNDVPDGIGDVDLPPRSHP